MDPPTYSATTDYRYYQVGERDHPLLSTGEAARTLGIRTTQGVRALISAGRLPSARTGRISLVPQWAVEGRSKHRARAQRDRGDGDTAAHNELTARVLALEEALAALRMAEEHSRRAREHEQAALREWGIAYGVLHDAVGAVLVPVSARELH